MAALISRMGGAPSISPSMREVALERNPEAIDFANRLLTGQVDGIIFMTGVGVRHLIGQVERHVNRKRFLEAISDVVTIARGPKPTAVLKEFGLTPTHRTEEPNTWREVLAVIDQRAPVANQTVALVEYGQPNTSLVAGLEARGAIVLKLKVYRWDLPEDTGPLENNIRAIADGLIDVALFTSSHQVTNLLLMAERLGLTDSLRFGLSQAVIASIGPDTSETLRQYGFSVDLEPEHSGMGQLVVAASRSGELLTRKRRKAIFNVPLASATGPVGNPIVSEPGVSLAPRGQGQPWYDSPFMKACRLEPTERTPVWLMRQAGRYLPEYRAIREKTSFLELCKNPALCAEVMIAAVRRLGVDAAIIFADLLPILEPMGMELEFTRGEGPVIHNPVRESRDVDRVLELDGVASLEFVMEAVRLTRAGLSPEIPLLGFAGAPFTLASYVIEGGASRNYLHTKTLMHRDAGAWSALMSRLVRATTRYLNAQIAAGAQAVQLFDSWVGCLGPDDYRQHVLPHTKAVIDGIQAGVPVINFATGNPALLPLLSEAGGQVIGADWRIELNDAWRAIGANKAIQGNLDPAVLLADRSEIRRRAEHVLRQAAGRPGHIFNLGHGVLPQTPPDNAIALVDAVHEFSARA
ncbi:MAG TPA: uroporphyrinogen decarboxylase [Pirellulales bacterium]|nr:uroporphyrinogen decarboxylase [Pirellulales bacterium]